MNHFNVEVKPVEPQLRMLIARFPSRSQVALIHDAEEKLRAALQIWLHGRKDETASLLVDACTDLYNVADSLAR